MPNHHPVLSGRDLSLRIADNPKTINFNKLQLIVKLFIHLNKFKIKIMKKILLLFSLLTINAFSQTPGNGVIDIDSNHYNSVNIGTQEWQKENLNVSKYTDGTIIPQVTDPTQWANLTTGAWCYYNNDPTNGAIYGKLYNWYAVAGIYDNASLNDTALRKQLAPLGWHVPSDGEWTILSAYLGGVFGAGGKMKSTSTLWMAPNTDATNSSGFSALPGAFKSSDTQNLIGIFSHFWCMSELNANSALFRYLFYNHGDLLISNDIKQNGMSVRCINNIALNNQSFNSNSFNIYPNPAKEQFTIDFTNNSNVINWNYKIVNTLGQELINGVLNSHPNIIQLNNIKEQGVYLVKIYDNSNTLVDTKKIIIQE